MGFVGLTVVRARLNAITPSPLVSAPIVTHAIAKKIRPGIEISPIGRNLATTHMSEAVNSTTTTGGILSSKDFTN